MFVLAGYYWTQNVGDMALRHAAKELLGDRLGENLWAGHLGEWFHQPGGPRWGEVKGLILPGGGLLQDLGGWDPEGWGSTSTPAVFWASVMVEAAAHGVPVVAWANGFGPFEHHDALEFSRAAYEVTSYRSWRDEASARLAGVGGPVTADLALTCGVELSPDPGAPLAVVLRPFPGEVAPQEVVAAVGALLMELGRPFLILPFEAVDAEHTEALAQLPGAVLVEPDLSWQEKVLALGRCSGVVTNRFHAAIWGLAAGAPVLALPTDDSKLLSAVEMFGSQVRVTSADARQRSLLREAWRAAEAEVSGGGAEARRDRAADLARRVREEADDIVELLRSRNRPTPVDPVVTVLVSSLRARTSAWGEQRHEATRLHAEVLDLVEQRDRSALESHRARDAVEAQSAELATANDRLHALRVEADALRVKITETAGVADDLYQQLQEIQGSTAWRASAPIRALGTARRRAAPLLPYVNARRVRAAARLAVRGDFATMRQRLEATSAVAGAAQGDVPPGRNVVRRTAEPWSADLPLVSVVIPCFNYGAYVDEAIDSVLRQTLGDRVELIVVDGGSTDPATQRRLQELADSPPPRTRVLLRQDGRHLVGDNRNFGLSRARGKYVCCLDADDVLDPVYLDLAVFLAERYGYGLVSTATRCFGTVTDTFGLLPEPDLQDMLLANNVTTVAVFERRLWERSGGYRDTGLGAEHVHEDWQLWVRLAALGARIHNIVGIELFRYRVHSSESLSNHAGVREMNWQREAVQQANADVVTPEALKRSAEERELEVIVEGALENLLPAENDTRPGLLLCMPFLLLGGAERLLSGLVASLTHAGFRVVIVTTLPAEPAFGDSTPWFASSTAEIFHLPRLLESRRWGDFLHHLVDSKGLDLLLLAGSAYTYALLPELKKRHPHLRVADLLFNTVGHTESNRRYAEHIDLHLCENAEVEHWLREAGEPPEKVIQIDSGVDIRSLYPVDRPARDHLLIGYSGRLADEKDPLAFVELAEAARDSRLRFVMTGAGPLEGAVRKRIARSRGAVEFLGIVDDVHSHMAGLDLLVVPSRLDGRPLAVLEALAMGVPVLATRVGGLPELVIDNVTGFTCAPGAAATFANRLRELLDDPDRLLEMKRNARQFAEERLDQSLMHARYEEALRRLLH